MHLLVHILSMVGTQKKLGSSQVAKNAHVLTMLIS